MESPVAAVGCFPGPECPDSRLSNSQQAPASGAGETPTFTSRIRAQLPAASSAPGVLFCGGGNTLCCRPREGVSTSRLSCPGLSRASRLVGHGFAFLIEMAGTSPAMTLNMWREPTVPIRLSPRKRGFSSLLVALGPRLRGDKRRGLRALRPGGGENQLPFSP
jgi:hypothetical protein